jgi:hypothetical protein
MAWVTKVFCSRQLQGWTSHRLAPLQKRQLLTFSMQSAVDDDLRLVASHKDSGKGNILKPASESEKEGPTSLADSERLDKIDKLFAFNFKTL